MKDFISVELEVGDRVVFVVPRYSLLKEGTILKLGNKMATIGYPDRQGKEIKVTRYYSQVVSVESATK